MELGVFGCYPFHGRNPVTFLQSHSSHLFLPERHPRGMVLPRVARLLPLGVNDDIFAGKNVVAVQLISKLTPYCEPSPLLRQGVAKSLCLIPERIKIAAQGDRWIIRSTIVWQKPNCIPESVKDRCAQSYEQIIMLTRYKNYFWNTAEAVEPSICWQKGTWGSAEKSLINRRAKLQLTMRHGNKIGCSKTEKRFHNFIGAGPKGDAFIFEGIHGERSAHRMEIKPTRTLRDVWSIPTHAHPDDHVAIFPEALVERLIRISTKPGDTVLDPFAGSGTTGIVAERLGRNSILLDTSEQYCQLMKRRIVREDAISVN